MRNKGPKGYTKDAGIAINMEQPPTGGRHRATATYGVGSDLTLTPRQALAREIWDVRSIYANDGLYNQRIRRSIQEVIKLNRQRWPGFFDKPLNP